MACTCKQYQKSIIDVYNTTSQSVAAGGNVVFNGVSVDSGSSITQATSSTFQIKNSGIYGVRFVGNLYNSTDAAVTVQMQLTNNGNNIAGTTQYVTVPATGYAPVVIAKDVQVNSTSGSTYVTLAINGITAATLTEANITIERKA